MKYKKLLFFPMVFALLGGCATATPSKPNDYTNSITTETSTYRIETSAPNAEPVNESDDLSTKKIVWGVGNIQNHNQPTEPANLQKKYESLNARWLLDEDKTVCLTFDEGYENGFTPAILDTLKEKNVKAIFFVTYDFARDNPKLVKRMIDEGHTVGNHSYRHYSMDEVSDDVATQEVLYLHNYILKEFGYTMSYFRFPKGEFSQRVLSLVNDLEYKSVFWSFAYSDWDPSEQMEPERAFAHICESTHDGEIILLHAVSKTNSDILAKVIDDIRKQGYTFTTQV